MNINSIKGFTLIELLIVILVIGIISAVAFPNYAKSRTESQKNACIANLRQINTAIDQWAMENKIPAETVPPDGGEDEASIYSYIRGSKPKCPGGGVYTIHAVGDPQQVTCSLEDRGHKLP